MKNVYNTVNKSEHTFAHILSILQIQFIHELNRFEPHASNYIWISFFNSKSYSITQYTDGWIYGHGATPATEDQL